MMGCQSVWDEPVISDMISLGTGGTAGRVAIVYHPGGSSFPERAIIGLAEELVSRGFVVDIATASPQTAIEQSLYCALVLGSPVYGSAVRPPVMDFVSANAPFSMPVFALLTGAFAGFYETYDLPNLVAFAATYDVTITAAIKIKKGASRRRIRRQVGELADELEQALATPR
jgi:hypothetical protein